MSDADRAVVMMLHDNAAMIGKCERLQAENAKLVMKLNAEHLVRQNVERENAKLRELVRDMAAEIRGLGVDFKRVGWCDYADRMRELGVDA